MGYMENGESETALQLFSAMDVGGVVKDSNDVPGGSHGFWEPVGGENLLGRANSTDECLKVVRDRPFEGDVVTCTSILGGCRKWNNVEVGEMAYEALTRLEKKDGAAYGVDTRITQVLKNGETFI